VHDLVLIPFEDREGGLGLCLYNYNIIICIQISEKQIIVCCATAKVDWNTLNISAETKELVLPGAERVNDVYKIQNCSAQRPSAPLKELWLTRCRSLILPQSECVGVCEREGGGSGIRPVKHLSLNSVSCVSFMVRCFHSVSFTFSRRDLTRSANTVFKYINWEKHEENFRTAAAFNKEVLWFKKLTLADKWDTSYIPLSMIRYRKLKDVFSYIFIANLNVILTLYCNYKLGIHRIFGNRIYSTEYCKKKPHSVFGGMSEKQGPKHIHIFYIYIIYIYILTL